MLNGTNFKSWQENVMIVLGVMDLDLVLRVTQPIDLTKQSCFLEKSKIERWDRLNHINVMIMKRAIPEAFRSAMFKKITTTEEFLEEIKKRFGKNEKAETSTLLTNFISMRYNGKNNIRENMMEMSHLPSKLKALKLELFEDLLVHLILISLPT